MALTKVTGNGLGAFTQNGAAVFNESSADTDFRIESNGQTHMFFMDAGNDRVGIGTSSPNSSHKMTIQAPSEGGAFCINGPSTNGYQAMQIFMPNGSTKGIQFLHNNSDVGSIVINSSSTAFNTSSDYRLKENVDYTWDATTRLKQLKPVRFNFIVDDTNTPVDGFLAHEVSSIVPEAITGEKDEVDNNGDAVMQSIDQSKLVPLLIKTVQELEARITALESG